MQPGWPRRASNRFCAAAASGSFLPGQCHGLRILPECARWELPLGPGASVENVVPAVGEVDHQRIEKKAFEHLHLQIRLTDVLDHFLRCLLRLIVSALLGSRVGDEVNVVCPVEGAGTYGCQVRWTNALSAAAAYMFVCAARS